MNKIVILKKNEDRRILRGHLWAFSNEISEIKGDPHAGDVIELRDHAGKFLGRGFYNPHSLIAVRLLTRQEEEIDSQFFQQRIKSALTLRKHLYPSSDTFRLVHGESDFLPGLIIDKYNEYFSIQAFSFGMDQRLQLICDVLESMFHPKGIIERNEALTRLLDGLPQKKGILRGSVEPVIIIEHNIKYEVDILEGQKTGFFLDLRENRLMIRRYCNGARVLDCFCCEGGFALNAANAGASQVVGIDISEPTIHRATNNATLNNVTPLVKFHPVDAFTWLKEAVIDNQQFDVVILDPPSFAKNKRTLLKAKRGYGEINLSAFQLLKPGGILATASCSHHVTEETFLGIIQECSLKTGRSIRLLEWHGAAPDHPVLPAMPETQYLKLGIFQID